VFTAAVPAVIAKPKLAFDVQTGGHSKGYGVLAHDHSPKRIADLS
jgi:hypothetical protein